MEQREGGRARWTPCHVELTPCELRLYVLDSSANRQLGTAYSLSHCQGVVSPAPCGPPGQSGHLPTDPRTLQALFFNSTRLQLRAASQREAGEWRRAVWEKVQAARPPAPRQESRPRKTAGATAGQQAAVAFAPSPSPSPSGLDTRPDGQSDAPSPEEVSPHGDPDALCRPTALPLFTQRCPDVLKAGLLRQLLEQNNWLAFTFVLSRSALRAFPTEGRGPVSRPVLHRAMASCLAVRHQPESGEPWAELEPAGGDCFEVVFPGEVFRLRADTRLKALEWVEALREVAGALGATSGDEGQPGETQEPGLQGALLRPKPSRDRRQREAQRAKRQSVTTSFLGILTHLAVEKGLTAQSFRCAGK